jgi:hypothetical protein
MGRYVSVSGDDLATVDDVMELINRLPYLDMIEFAGMIEGDADKIADAARAYATPEPEEANG